MKKNLMLASALLASVSAMADSPSLGNPIFGGNGCPSGTVTAVLNDNASTLSILFDNYIAEAGRAVNRQLDRKSCNISIPVHVPQGYSVAIFQVDYRGFNALPNGGTSAFNVEYFFAGRQGPAFTKSFRGPLTDDYLLSNTLVASNTVWSACGETPILRANSSLRVNTNSRGDQTLATLDSADVTSSLVYHLQWKTCRR